MFRVSRGRSILGRVHPRPVIKRADRSLDRLIELLGSIQLELFNYFLVIVIQIVLKFSSVNKAD